MSNLLDTNLPAPVIIAADAAKVALARTTTDVQRLSASLSVTDADSYQTADSLLAKVKTARKTIEEKFEPIIRPIRTGLDALYALKRELDLPLSEAEASVKGQMSAWQLTERRRIESEKAAAENERRRLAAEAQRKADEQARAEREAEDARRRAEELRGRDKATALAQAKAAELRAAQAADQAREIETRQYEAQTAAQQRPVAGASSSTRYVESWTVTDIDALIAAVARGEVPATILRVDDAAMDEVWAVDRETMLSWPGVTKGEKVVIAGRTGARK